ncbi:hypothetical protein [Vibrio sp. ABG19]|uniref:hypothetical protein n=1 Tax=Vibrio sp. ABG19 TaxID=2817385 RepID=UPI00249F721E|nr:hypothetical protein [Vibrio sp. ABG19]WGY45737.1 hypothetical protein J0X00_02485 [Vibrio sp. ABG19]
MTPFIAASGGWLLMISQVISLCAQMTGLISGYWAGVPIWIAAALFITYIKPAQKKQIVLLLVIGLAGLIYGMSHGADMLYVRKALEANQNVVTMLIGVGFLRIFAVESVRSGETLPQGKSALLRTLFGTHLFGSVLNMSSVIIVGDKIAAQGRLSTTQGLVLLRAFAACAFWSPFFASMGLALISAPGAQLSTLVAYGIPVALVALGLSAWHIWRQPDSDSLAGYPVTLYSLWMPALLAVIVISAHELFPHVSVLSLVTLTAITFTAGWLLLKKGKPGVRIARNHINVGIASSCGEVVLFAAAAMLASGVAATLMALDIQLAPAHFGAFEACITVLVLIVLAMTGMHPVTSVVLAGSILAPSVSDPNLLGMTLLMGWSLGITLSPFSGIQLSIQSRYAVGTKALLNANWRYIGMMYLVCSAMIGWYSL